MGHDASNRSENTNFCHFEERSDEAISNGDCRALINQSSQ